MSKRRHVRSNELEEKKANAHPPAKTADAVERASEAGQPANGFSALQQQMGNRAMHRIIQRQAFNVTQPQPVNPLDPAMMAAAAQKVISETQAPVRSWLEANTEANRQLTMAELVARVRQNVPEAVKLTDQEVQFVAREWAASKGILIPTIPQPGTAITNASVQIPDTVKNAFSLPIKGVDWGITKDKKLNISAKGLTAQLKKADINISWGGVLGIELPGKGFHLTGKVGLDTWEVSLTMPDEYSIPDLSSLAEVFRKAESGLRESISATGSFNSLEDAGKVKDAISPSIKPVKEAVDALTNISQAPRVSFGISASGPMPGSPSSGAPSEGGATVTATVTIRF